MKEKFKLQDDQYQFPYHHLVGFSPFTNYAVMSWGFEYYAYVSWVIRIIQTLTFETLLDVGCGDGKMLLELNRQLPGKRLKGIDLSERAILFAKAFSFGDSVEFAAQDLAGVQETYDIVTLVETIEHIPDEEIAPFLQAIFARLKPGGSVIVTVPTTNFPVQAKHHRHYDLTLLKAQFANFDLKDARYLVKHGRLYATLIRISRKLCSFAFVQKAVLAIAKRMLIDATPTTGRHLVCLFRKSSI